MNDATCLFIDCEPCKHTGWANPEEGFVYTSSYIAALEGGGSMPKAPDLCSLCGGHTQRCIIHHSTLCPEHESLHCEAACKDKS